MTSQLALQFFLLKILLLNYALADCPDGAIEGFDGQTCYLYERFPAQFVTAERLCRDSHGHLASISDLFINDFVAQGGVEAFEVMQVKNFWIGGNDLEKRDRWEWIDGASFDFKNWASHEPVNDQRSFCSALSLPDGLWVARSCYESKPYVCELPALKATSKEHRNITTPLRSTRHHRRPTTPTRHSPNATQSTSLCENGWAYLKTTDLCYKVVEDASDCYRPNTQEASIHTKEENNFIGELAKKAAEKSENVKIRLSLASYNPPKKGKSVQMMMPPQTWGITDPESRRQYFNNLRESKKHHKKHHSSEEQNESWKWFDGSEVDYQNWAKKEPKKFDEFTCAQLNTKNQKFTWSSTDCLKAEYAVCSQQPNRH